MQCVQYIESNCDQCVPTYWALLCHSFSRNSNDGAKPCQNSLKLDLLNLTRVNELPVLNLTSNVRRMWRQHALALSRLQETIHCWSSQPSAIFPLTAGAATTLSLTLSLHTWSETIISCLSVVTFPSIFWKQGGNYYFPKPIKRVKYLRKECDCINQS